MSSELVDLPSLRFYFFFVLFPTFWMLVPCGRLSWLTPAFALTLKYCIVSYRNGVRQRFTVIKPPRRRAGLILIHHFPLSQLLFHNRRSLPVPIRDYHLQTLLTLLWLPYTFFPLSLSSPFSLLPRPHPTFPTYAYNMLIQLIYRVARKNVPNFA